MDFRVGFLPTIDKERRPCYHKEKSGELVKQAERKSSNFDPLPDADNAAVGSHSWILSEALWGMPPIFYIRLGRERGGAAR